MFNETTRYVTKEEVENSYEFKLIKKILKREYPWIKDVLLHSDEEINEYALIFTEVLFDPFELQRETGWPFNAFMKFYFGGKNFIYPNEPFLYKTSYLTTIYNVDRDETSDITNGVENIMRQVSKSPAIPSDLKLGKDRTIVVGEWVAIKVPVPEDAVYAKPDK